MGRLARDNSDLPKAKAPDKSMWAPDAEPRFGPTLVNLWHAEATDRPMAAGNARFRYSNAGACSRLLAYAAMRLPYSDLVDPPGSFIMRQGDILHEAIQATIAEAYPGTEIEVPSTIGDDMAGHADVEVRMRGGPEAEPGGWVTSIEVKSSGGFAYKQAVGDRYAPQGPKYQHVIQAALNGRARNADEVVILYLARDAIAVRTAKTRKMPEMLRVTAEWTLPRSQYEPIADKEIERVSAILGLLDEGTLPRRRIPDPELPVRHMITNASTGDYVETDTEGVVVGVGSYWGCDYCRYQRLCALTPGDRAPVDVAYEAVAQLELERD